MISSLLILILGATFPLQHQEVMPPSDGAGSSIRTSDVAREAAGGSVPAASADTTLPAPNDTIPPAPADTTLPAPNDTIPPAPADTIPEPGVQEPDEEEEEEEELEVVAIWPELSAPGYRTAETDSTLRWFMTLNWIERLYRKPGVITYRTGRLGQIDGIDLHSYENRHQRLLVNELEISDRVTGQINWNRLPVHKIQAIRVDDRSYTYTARAGLREHYTVQPRTFLNFDEGGGDYRNMEFSFTHNMTARTNLEFSFWDRRDGDRFPRNAMEGRQLILKVRHNLTDEVKLKGGIINNSFDKQQSFGYNVPELAFFDFNPFNASALEPSANSKNSTNDFYVQIQQRMDEDVPASRAAGIQYQSDNWELEYSQDTTAYALRDAGAFAWQDIHLGESTLRAQAGAHFLRDGSGRSLTYNTWLAWNASTRGEFPLLSWLKADVNGRFDGRSDGKTGYEVSMSLTLEAADWLSLEGYGGAGSTIPQLQALYWSSAEFQGDVTLLNESGFHTGITSTIRLSSILSLGVRAANREVSNGIFLNRQGRFVNIDPYTNLSGTAWLELDSRRFEGSLSATGQQFTSGSTHPVNRLLDEGGERLWLKSTFYWKNDVFNEAAFIKAGLSGMLTPGNYRPSEFVVPLNRWQHGGESRLLPGFHRLDLNLSARIRWFMLLMRFENVLDGIEQVGYFEADSYPMPGRRFILGFRIVFTN